MFGLVPDISSLDSRAKHGNDRGEEKNTGMTRKVLVMFRLDPGIFLMDCQINFGNDNIIFLRQKSNLQPRFPHTKKGFVRSSPNKPGVHTFFFNSGNSRLSSNFPKYAFQTSAVFSHKNVSVSIQSPFSETNTAFCSAR